MSYTFIQTAYAATTSSKDEVNGLQTLIGTAIDQAPYWVLGLIIMFLGFIVAKILKNVVSDRVASKLDEEHQDIIALSGRATFTAVFVIGLTIGMKVAGLDLTPIIAAVGLGVGFAMQGIITNFVAGIIVVLSRHFTIGDYIQVGELVGKVVEIQTRATILQALDGTKVIVPNADLYNSQVTSFTSNPFRRHEICASVGYDCDLTKASQVCMATLLAMPGVLKEPAPQVIIAEFDNSWVNLTLRFWTESRANWLQIKSELNRLTKENLEKVGMYVPYPIQQVYRYDGEDTRKEQEKLMKEHFGEFESILKNNTAKKSELPTVKANGEEKSGSEFLATKI